MWKIFMINVTIRKLKGDNLPVKVQGQDSQHPFTGDVFLNGKKRTVTWREHGRRASAARDRCASALFDPLRGVWGSFDEGPQVKGRPWH